MNLIEELSERLVQRFPYLRARIDEPLYKHADWFLDLDLGDRSTWMVIVWRPGDDFCIVQPTFDDPIDKPDVCYPDLESVYKRIVELVLESEAYLASKGLAVAARQKG